VARVLTTDAFLFILISEIASVRSLLSVQVQRLPKTLSASRQVAFSVVDRNKNLRTHSRFSGHFLTLRKLGPAGLNGGRSLQTHSAWKSTPVEEGINSGRFKELFNGL